jgi:tRNA (cytidine32/uridine32-2'-O)-methyltransferase
MEVNILRGILTSVQKSAGAREGVGKKTTAAGAVDEGQE